MTTAETFLASLAGVSSSFAKTLPDLRGKGLSCLNLRIPI